MRLIELPAWVDKYFAPESRPSEQVTRRWARTGRIPAVRVGKAWYVDEHRWLTNDDPDTADLVQRVLEAG